MLRFYVKQLEVTGTQWSEACIAVAFENVVQFIWIAADMTGHRHLPITFLDPYWSISFEDIHYLFSQHFFLTIEKVLCALLDSLDQQYIVVFVGSTRSTGVRPLCVPMTRWLLQ